MNEEIDTNSLPQGMEQFFHKLFFDPDFKITNPIGTIESELNFTFNALVRNGKSQDPFWKGLLDTFNSLPPKKEYVNAIYNTICFLGSQLPQFYKKNILEIAKRKRFENLRRARTDIYDLNDLLINNLVSATLRVDNSLETLLLNGVRENKPYYFYLLSKYYYNIDMVREATDLLYTFLEREKTESNILSFKHCLYALDENVPDKIRWIEIFNTVSTNFEFHRSRKHNWQYSIFSSLLNKRSKEVEDNVSLSHDDLALILINSYFKNLPEERKKYYSEFSVSLTDFEMKYPSAMILSRDIFPRAAEKLTAKPTQTLSEVSSVFHDFLNNKTKF